MTILFLLGLLDNMISVIGALLPFYLALVIIWIMRPFSELLQKKFNWSAKKASLISILVNLVIVLFIIFVIVPILIIQVWDITQNSTQIIDSINTNISFIFEKLDEHKLEIVDSVTTQINSILDTKSIPELISSIDLEFIPNAISSIFSFVGSTTSLIIQFVFAYIIAIYLSADFDQFVEKGLDLVFSNTKSKNKKVFVESTHALSGYFKGLMLDCTFIATIMTIGCIFIGIPSPLLFGIICGLFNVIPYLGPVLGGIPLVFVALSLGIPSAIMAIILILITQMIESQILQPKIMAKSTDLHPVTVICGLIIFGQIFGFVGMIIATPTLAVIAVVIRNSELDIRI